MWNLRGEAAGAGGGGRGGGGAAGQPAPVQFGRGGAAGGPAATPGRYRVVIGKLVGETFTPIGQPQFFQVVELPPQNYILYR